jgi:hypothetical protein
MKEKKKIKIGCLKNLSKIKYMDSGMTEEVSTTGPLGDYDIDAIY